MPQNQTISYWLDKQIKEQKIEAQIASKTYIHKIRVQKAKFEYYKKGFGPQKFLEKTIK